MTNTHAPVLGVVALTLAAGLAVLAPLGPSPQPAPAPLGDAGPGGASPVGDPDPARAAVGAYDWPLAPEPAVLRPFSEPEQVWSPGHRGVDLAGLPGQDVLAAADGVIAFAGRVVDRDVVSIDHPDGVRTTYEPVTTTLTVGAVVTRGDVVGRLSAGDAGPHCGPATWCLHWGARTAPQRYLDPLTLLVADPVIRLYPVAAATAPPARLRGMRGPPRTRTAASSSRSPSGTRRGPPAPPSRPVPGRPGRGPWPRTRWPGARR
ncbi:M23 family metallopeptidase [Occultella glacieicola]|uniref:M23 family metallopeptidase n=1 Tax=Occultella glacieicola TaxID=2518684 RepID=A0ABY2DWM9_9MICO|nr:M23 family metallopeptidase [Occultella glacieicola]